MLQIDGATLLLHRLLEGHQEVFKFLLLGQDEIQFLIQSAERRKAATWYRRKEGKEDHSHATSFLADVAREIDGGTVPQAVSHTSSEGRSEGQE